MISLAIFVFTLVCYWLIYEKLGIAGWKCLIPFYSSYVLCKRLRRVAIFVITMVAELIIIVGSVWITTVVFGEVLYRIGLEGISGGVTVAGILIPVILMTIAFIAIFVVTILLDVALSKEFGMGGAFVVGLIFLTTIFLGILALDSKIQAVQDADNQETPDSTEEMTGRAAVQPEENVDNVVYTGTAVEKGNKLCPYCNAEIPEDTKKCPYCRSEL